MNGWTVFIAWAGALLVGCTEAAAPPDLVLVGGEVRTPSGWADAIAVRDGRIVAVGDTATVAALGGDGTRTIDLAGATVLPGFQDLHVHPVYGGMLHSGADPTNCTIPQGATAEALVDALRECVARVSGDQWVTGGQWDAAALGVVPHRSVLDAVAPDTPVLLNDTSAHSVWANSKALALAGVDAKTEDPEGGIVERGPDGDPTGVLRESAASLVREHVPPPTDAVLRESLSWAQRTMLSYGITAYTEAANGFVGGALREAALYADLSAEGEIRQRIRVCLQWRPDDPTTDALIADRAQYESELVRFDCVKIFLDGVPTDSHTAAMLEPYAQELPGRDDRASRYGMLLVDQDALDEAVTRFDREGLTVKFHAAGDAAVRAGLDAIAAARAANGPEGPRHNVGHCTFIAEDDVPRAKPIGATFELSPYLWAPTPINDDITRAVGEARIRRVWPMREVIDSGALVIAGSDWAVVPSVNPWPAIETLVTRESPGGSAASFGKAEAISVAEAIDLFTANAARQRGREGELGALASGFLADLVVVAPNPYEAAPTDLHRTRVRMTFLEGELVYEAE